MSAVERVENGGLLFTDNSAGVSGVDCGYSIPLGRQVLWLFGDIFILHPSDPRKPYVGGVSNAALLTADATPAGLRRYQFLTDPTSGIVRQVLPNAPNEGTETRLWLFHGWYNRAETRIYVYFAKVRTTGGGGPFDFRVLGHGLARGDVRDPLALTLERVHHPEGGDLWWTAPEPLYGCAVIVPARPEDPYLYIVGVRETSGKKHATLARVRRQRMGSVADYEYLASAGSEPSWSQSPADAVDVPGLSEFPTELSIAYNRHLRGYLAVHSINISERIRLSLAPAPWGPYRTVAEIGAPHRAFEKAFCYAGKEHPEMAEQASRVLYLTYVDSQRYWLQLLKVTLR